MIGKQASGPLLGVSDDFQANKAVSLQLLESSAWLGDASCSS